jgi:hypothetical protein
MKGAARVLEIIQDRTTARASRPLDMPRSRRGPENVLRATPGDVREQHQRQPEGLEAYGEAKREPRARRCGVPAGQRRDPGVTIQQGLRADRTAAPPKVRPERAEPTKVLKERWIQNHTRTISRVQTLPRRGSTSAG